ncbi:MAG TPA: tetratricopeptide repeat protein [Candidatus Limnocylindrales bacterium]|nr:tetratricopeptide repeat protein [Candidatus Limnocylindrales bacterium]
MTVDVSAADFQTAVIDRSFTQPVVVDFWAEWCAPCRQLSPVLEREASRHSGKVELAKVDVDANPSLSQAYGIQGIPAVKAFSGGKVVAEFVGAQPAAAVARFFDSLLPSEAELLAEKGDEESLRAALELQPDHAGAAIRLARMLHERGASEEALDFLEKVHGSFAADGLAARIRLERNGAPDLSGAFAALDAGEDERALDALIETIPRARNSRDEIRRVVVGILDELGLDHPVATRARARLASALY